MDFELELSEDFPFTIIELLGSGSYGKVYKARSITNGEIVVTLSLFCRIFDLFVLLSGNKSGVENRVGQNEKNDYERRGNS